MEIHQNVKLGKSVSILTVAPREERPLKRGHPPGEGGKEGRREGGKGGRREGGKEGRREGGKEGRREGDKGEDTYWFLFYDISTVLF